MALLTIALLLIYPSHPVSFSSTKCFNSPQHNSNISLVSPAVNSLPQYFPRCTLYSTPPSNAWLEGICSGPPAGGIPTVRLRGNLNNYSIWYIMHLY
ncbi:hypothetical protein BGX38DRAFT_568438 [Terfezia claveryi]|nr:hypothetical protein BGX38DRAFT_568438 [Terfezia claveryi]